MHRVACQSARVDTDSEASVEPSPVDTGDDAAGDGDAAGDDIVLPWWQNPITIVACVLAAALLFGAVGYMVGYRSGEPSGNAVDTGFLQDMRYHHEQAVLMSRIYLATPSTDGSGAESNSTLRLIASEIELSQQQETGRMVQMLRVLGEPEAADLDQQAMRWMGQPVPYDRMPGLASEAELTELGEASGPAADELFAKLMVAHHQGGIHMAEYAIEHGSNGEVQEMAESMITGQQFEIAEMARLGFA
jgi:uncharacterized protein (DUF305 family)